MGFYDYRCMISGLSLKHSRKTILILTEKSFERDFPASLPVQGSYNRLGTIDCVEQDQNSEMILSFFKDGIASGEVSADWDEIKSCIRKEKIETIDDLLQAIERNVTMEYDCVTVNGLRPEYVLIDSAIFTAVTGNCSSQQEFEKGNLFTEIYSGKNLPQEKLSGLNSLFAFLKKHNLKFEPARDAYQHYEDEVLQFIGESKNIFKNEPVILNVISNYESDFRKDNDL